MSNFPSLFQSEFDSINLGLEKEKWVKSQGMIAMLQKAAHNADIGFQAADRLIKPGVSTEEIRQTILDDIASSTPKDHTRIKLISGSKIQPHLPTQESAGSLKEGDMLFLEITGKYQDVFFSSSRVFPVGTSSAGQEKFIKHLTEAFEWMNETIKPGTETALYYAESRGRMIAPYAHGIGSSLFEPPFIEPRKPYILLPGMILCLAPFVQSEEFGTAYLKEMVLITQDGCKRINDFPL
jgi:Xaa-Pro aminopeptidase